MKAFILLVFTVFTSLSFAQNTTSISKIGRYHWNNAVIMEQVTLEGKPLANRVVALSKQRQEFQVFAALSDGVVLRIVDYTRGTKEGSIRRYATTPNFFTYNFDGLQSDFDNLSDLAVNSKNYGTYQKYFKVGYDILESHAEKEVTVGHSLSFGVINFPFKLRTQKDKMDFTGALNFGAALGYKFKAKESRPFKWSLITGYSLSNVNLDAIAVKQNAEKLSTTNNFSAFSFSIGPMVEFARVQAGLFMGFDFLSRINQNEFRWDYHRKPWFSIGFGYSIFSAEKEKPTEGDTSQ